MKHLFSIAILFIIVFYSCKNNNTSPAKNEITITQEYKIPCNDLPYIDSLLLIDSLNGDLYSCRAELYFDNGRYSEALFDINNAIVLKGQNIPDLLLLSDIYFMLGNGQLARSAIVEAEKINNEDYTVYYALGKHNFRTGNFELAKGYLAKSIQINAVNPQSFFVLGQIAALEEDTARAITYYQNAIQTDYEFTPAYLQLAVINMDRDRSLVPQYLQNAISVKPDNPYAHFMLGVYYQEEEDYLKAKECYLESYNFDQKNKMTCFNLGYIYLTEMFLFDSAALWFDKTLALDPSFKAAQDNYKYSLELLKEENNE
ncbi:tetratricopeptide repeat protein [Odoribacter sp. OttesenSCG-928-L07]|nr:tetratricopeptide repeat protein [Odoribacter sp. OttesenSCG-928-L07]MDL2238723.1 tetratricopeptide repeat protein [Bacteroidales bacterium OttesenSCG-928-L14]